MDRPRTVLASLIAVLLLISVAFVLPFLDYFLLALLLAYILRPIQRRLSSVVGERLAASAVVLLASITIVLPTVFVIRTAFDEAQRLLRQIRTGAVGLEGIESSIQELAGVEVDLSELLRTTVNDVGVNALGDVLSLVGTAAHVVIGVGLTLFLVYYFLKDGDRFLAWLTMRLPLRHEVRRTLFAETRNITRAVLMGHVLVAVIQGLIAGLGLWVLDVPNAAFWTVVMVVLAILPIIGSFLIWGPAVVWLFLVDRPVAGLALLVYGTIVVGISDDYLRPIVVDRYAHVNPAVIIIGVFGGVYVIGFMGIFFGPILIGGLRIAIDVYDRELRETGLEG
jgi:predicted PurR-regulated permease PerM